ncbi:MAG TPA: iron-containing alcohol dehydrogenase, partial [Methanobacterium sp.]|nr:iron-containing alcohol dehydrogenase [Methanobacterium sp.]
KTVKNPENLAFRGNMMLGSLEAGLAFSNASLGVIHAMAHSVGGFLDLHHGECNAILLDHVIDFNFEAEPERYENIGEMMGIDFSGMMFNDKKRVLLQEIKSLKDAVGVNSTLKQIGVKKEDIPALSKNAMEDPCIITNPRTPKKEEIEKIFENAL